MSAATLDGLLARLEHAIEALADNERSSCDRLERQLREADQARALDQAARRIALLERQVNQLELALAIARDERTRAEARVAELELALDAMRAGIDAKIPPAPRRTLPWRAKPAETIVLANGRRRP